MTEQQLRTRAKTLKTLRDGMIASGQLAGAEAVGWSLIAANDALLKAMARNG